MMVSTGISALRSACRHRAWLRLNPFARAVRMKSSSSVSISEERMTRARIEACGRASAMAGRVSAFKACPKPASHPGKPPAENQRRLMAKTSTRIMANQKLGMATPSWVAPMTERSAALLRRAAAMIPAGKAIRVDSARA